MSDDQSPTANVRVTAAEMPALSGLLTLAIAVVVIAALYLARDLLVPVTLAVLLSFVLAPFVRLLRWAKVPRPPAALIAVLLALAVILAIGGVIGAQIASLAQDLPRYQTTIREKADTVRSATIGRITRFLERLDDLRTSGPGGAEPSRGRPGSQASPRSSAPAPAPGSNAAGAGSGDAAAAAAASPVTMLGKFVSPVLSPIAALGIVLVITLFILLQQDDLRDRFIRLVGARDLHRTTVALNDAVRRLSKYFLAQLALNSAFGVLVAVALYLIGLPSPVLWGVVAGLLRFIPYVGAWIAAALPLVVAAAVDPGWSMFAWTLALFVIAEPIMGQIIEPLVYGRSTGLTPLSVVFATIFWTWLWGPIGLILATPLTLCLVVLGRHVDRLEFLDVLLGDRPALSPIESFYQRMLAGDPDEVQDQAELSLRALSLSAYYDDIALKGLKLAAEDALRGALSTFQLVRIRDSVEELVAELADYDDVTPTPIKASAKPIAIAPDQPEGDSPPDARPAGRPPAPELEPLHAESEAAVLCAAGASPLDEAACAMLAQLLGKRGLKTKRVASDRASRAATAGLDPGQIALVCVSAVETSGNIGRLRLIVRRLRRQLPDTQVVLGLWPRSESAVDSDALLAEIGADRCVSSLTQAVRVCLDRVRSSTGPSEKAPGPRDAGKEIAAATLAAKRAGMSVR